MAVSRRLMTGGALAALACGRAWAGAPPPQQVMEAQADETDRLTVEVRIDGKGPFRFLVDTGADRTVISDELAARFGPPDPELLVVQGIAATITAPAVRLTNLSFGPLTLESLRAPVLPHAALGADGYLGLDAIGGHRVVFDFRNRVLSIEEAHVRFTNEARDFDIARVAVQGSGGKLVSTDCLIDSTRVFAFVDTGAEVTLGNARLLEKLRNDNDRAYHPGPEVAIAGVTGGHAMATLVDVGRVKLGGVQFSGCTLAVCDLPIFSVWGMADRPALLVGMNFLKRTESMSIDYRRQEILFRVAEARIARAG
jgi:predicted aspartyl protease